MFDLAGPAAPWEGVAASAAQAVLTSVFPYLEAESLKLGRF
jgi:hypothetical protein